MKDYIIFGTGRFGEEAYKEYSKKGNVKFFIDTNEDKIGKTIYNLEIRPVKDIVAYKESTTIIIASGLWYHSMERTLKRLQVSDYIYYGDGKKIYGGSENLVLNPYENGHSYGFDTESEWNESIEKYSLRKLIYDEAGELYKENYLFDYVEIETINRCNGLCDFCPVSAHHDTREYHEMSWSLFQLIIDQLSDMNYSGRIALYSNNEPFIDKGIIEKHCYAREKLPHARFHLYTNGTLLTIEKFTEIIKYLDELVIDNYNQDLKLIKPCKEIVAYAETHPEIVRKVTIVLRKPHEILTSRGGDAPNRSDRKSYPNDRCMLPYKQLIIRPDGKVSLCCNDPLGKSTMGDLTKETLEEVWYGEKFKDVRNKLYQGRGSYPHCQYCDTFIVT